MDWEEIEWTVNDMLLIQGLLFAICTVGLFVGLPLWYFWCVWLPWTGDIIEEAVHGDKESGNDND